MNVRVAVGAIATLAFLVSPYLGIFGWTPPLATVALFTAVCLAGLNLTFGYCGMLAFGQAAFAAIAAYMSGLLNVAGIPILLAAAGAVCISTIIARLLAVIFVRLPGTYLAIATLGLAYVVEGIARAFPSVTGGASGLLLHSPFPLGETGWYLVAFASATLAALLTTVLMRGGYARTLKLIRTDELGAEVVGINVWREKTFLFTVGAAFTSVGGVLLATYSSIVTPEFGGPNASLEYLAMTIIGGAGTAAGPLFGATALYWLFSISGAGQKYELLIYGACFLAVVLFAPQGIAGFVRRGFNHLLPQPLLSDLKSTSTRLVSRTQNPPGVLVIEDIQRYFGGVKAVSHVSAEFKSGNVIGLLGPNGAGKTTLFNILCGIETPNTGNIILRGESIIGLGVSHRASVIGRSFQVPRLVVDMTALENVVIRADQIFKKEPESERLAIAYSQLKRLGLSDIANEVVSDVAVGLHKLVDLARAAVGAPPLLLLDEPAVGLTGPEITRLREIILGFKETGTIVVVVDHNVDFIRSVADQVLVMESGQRIAFGPCDDVLNDPRVQSAYLGVLP
jgi:ABC-type branched-subunit amino acid transport system ATPase component/ABC-type branched-subunit amino acid transport system permease subunit